MKRRMFAVTTIAALGATLTALLPAHPAAAAISTLVADAYTNSTAPTANKGTATTLNVSGPPDSTHVQNAYVRFDLSTLPAAATADDIAKATLTIYVNKVTGSGSFDVQRVATAWTESTISAGSAPTLGTAEQSAVPVASTDANQFKVVDVTSVVKAWRDGSLTNNGLAVVANAVDGLDARFDSKESTKHSQVPRLEITLTTAAGGSGTVTNVSAASPLSVTNPSTTPSLTLGTVPIANGGTNATGAAAARGNLGAAASGSNSDITTLSGLTTPLTLGQGGTNANSAATARSNLGAAAIGSNADITALSGLTTPLTLNQGGTSAATAGGARTNLGAAASGANADVTSLSAIGSGSAAAPSISFSGDSTTGVFSGAPNEFDIAAGGTNQLAVTPAGVGISTVLALPSTTSTSGYITLGGNTFLHGFGGYLNTFVGIGSGNTTLTGTYLTGMGEFSLTSDSSGTGNTALGAAALTANTTGSFNTAAGASALVSNDVGSENAAFGGSAMYFNTSGARNTGLGIAALEHNTTGSSNTAVGRSALFFNTVSQNTAVGDLALGNNTSGTPNSAVGYHSLLSNTTGASNSALGANSLAANTTGPNNTAVGSNALAANTTAQGNTAIGFGALAANTIGDFNAALGLNALTSNTTGVFNTAVGVTALKNNTSGPNNTALGFQALFTATTAFDNVAVGRDALVATTTGTGNSAVGHTALSSNTVGTGNIAIGNNAGNALTTGNDNIDVGNGGVAAEASTIRIGSPQTRTFIAGIRGITTGAANGVAVLIDSNGQLGTISSSRRFKTDIRDMGDVSSRLMDLRPVTFKYKPELDPSGTPQYGLIAEEVERVFPDLVAYDNDGRIETVKYHLLSALLLNELQKSHRQQVAQAAEIRAVRAQQSQQTETNLENTRLARDNEALRERLTRLEQVVGHLAMQPAASTAISGRDDLGQNACDHSPSCL